VLKIVCCYLINSGSSSSFCLLILCNKEWLSRSYFFFSCGMKGIFGTAKLKGSNKAKIIIFFVSPAEKKNGQLKHKLVDNVGSVNRLLLE